MQVRPESQKVDARALEASRKMARELRLSVQFCGESLNGASWQGWVWEHPLVGDSKDAYVAEYDAIAAGMMALAAKINDEFRCQHCDQPHLTDVECPAPSTRMDSPGMFG